MIEKGRKVKLTINDLASGGDGVGRLEDGLVVFVPRTVPGESIKAEITEVKKNYARGKIVEILHPSSHRTSPPCPVFKECGGCQLQHITYKFQLKQKKGIVEDAFRKIADITDDKINNILGMDFPWYYRNKSQLPVSVDNKGDIFTGFYARGTHRTVKNDNCSIQHQLINRIKKETEDLMNEFELQVYNEQEKSGLIRHLVIRCGTCTNQALLILVTAREDFPQKEQIASRIMERVPELKSVFQNVNPVQTNVVTGDKYIKITGENKITEYLGQVQYKISPGAFFQVNTLQAERLLRYISDRVNFRGDEIILDAYCGLGSIGLYLADQVEKVYGIEEVLEAIKDARQNALVNGIDNCKFFNGQVEEKFPELCSRGIKPDIILVDPPRKGLSNRFCSQILKYTPQKVIYISCKPSTMARDINMLNEKYNVDFIQPVDMFPQTYHIENIAVLNRK